MSQQFAGCRTLMMISIFTSVVPSEAADTRPNIVFLMADDHRAYALGCMGDEQIETPNLDRLAERGVLFERCYAPSPLCMASRATVMTGLYEYKTGCNFQTGALSIDRWSQSYPLLLKQAGYRIAFAAKWGFHPRRQSSASSHRLQSVYRELTDHAPPPEPTP